jgi:hypothetical protein
MESCFILCKTTSGSNDYGYTLATIIAITDMHLHIEIWTAAGISIASFAIITVASINSIITIAEYFMVAAEPQYSSLDLIVAWGIACIAACHFLSISPIASSAITKLHPTNSIHSQTLINCLGAGHSSLTYTEDDLGRCKPQ